MQANVTDYNWRNVGYRRKNGEIRIFMLTYSKKKKQEKKLKAYNSESLIVRKQGSSEVLSFYTNLFLHRQVN